METLYSMMDWLDPAMLREVLLYDRTNPLLFNTGLFLLLFLGFLCLYHLVRRWRGARMVVIILFSLYFYYKSSAECCFILLGVCIGDYVLGRVLGSVHQRWGRRLCVWVNVLLNVGMLVWFKYFNLLYETFANITHTSFDPLDIILPAGISFFSFRSISYIVDIYRGRIEPCRNLLDYTFFLTFFPPLLAGPVVRAEDMLPQVKASAPATHEMVSEGLWLIMAGLVKKVVVADYLSGNFVDRIFDNPSLYTGFENLMGMFGFTIQLYCDFSGYSDMAIGLALLMGFRFKPNFDAPFKAQSPTEFWHRWHMSLSTWLRDYVYIPLGGNRRGRKRKNVNLVATMVIGGLWHGASWMYMLWGAYHGLLLVAHKWVKSWWPTPAWLHGTRVAATANIGLTLVLVVIGFACFRTRSLETLADMGTAIATRFAPEVIPAFLGGYTVIVVVLVLAYVMHLLPARLTAWVMSVWHATPRWGQAAILAVVLFLIVQARQTDVVPFLYLKY